MNEHQILSKLQEIDSKLDALDRQEKNLPERDRYVELTEELKKTNNLHKAVENKLHDESLIQKRLDDEVNSLNSKIQREQNRLYSGTISNPKELSSVQQEVTHLKQTLDEKEFSLLEQIEIVDKLKSDERIINDRVVKRSKQLEEAKSAMEAILAKIADERSQHQGERKPLYDSLSEAIQSFYNKTRLKHLIAVTTLENGICLGCRVELPSTDTDRIEASTKPEKCPSCGRIVVKPK